MDKSIIAKKALGSVVGAVVYIAAVAFVMNNAETLFGQMEGSILPFVGFLTLFVFSASVMGLLIFGRPITWYLDGQKREAITLLSYTLLGIGIVVLLILITLT